MFDASPLNFCAKSFIAIIQVKGQKVLSGKLLVPCFDDFSASEGSPFNAPQNRRDHVTEGRADPVLGPQHTHILDEVPEEVRQEPKAHMVAIQHDADYTQGDRLVKEVIKKYGKRYASPIVCLNGNLAAGLAHLRLPGLHRRSLRATNLVERSFEDKRSRANVLPRFRTERERFMLVLSVVSRASSRWWQVPFSEIEQAEAQADLP